MSIPCPYIKDGDTEKALTITADDIFEVPHHWSITEWVDGVGFTVFYSAEHRGVSWEFEEPVSPAVEQALGRALSSARFTEVFMDDWAQLHGVAYGDLVKDTVTHYKSGIGFRIHDVVVNAEHQSNASVLNFCTLLNLWPMAFVAYESLDMARRIAQSAGPSFTAMNDGGRGGATLGIVGRTEPLVYTLDGQPLQFKLMAKDF